MIHRLQSWLDRVPTRDALQQQQAGFYQLLLIGWIILVTLGMPLNFLRGPGAAPPPTAEAIPPIILVLIVLLMFAVFMLWLSPVIALVLLRRGRFGGSVIMAAWGLLFGHSIATLALGAGDASVYVVYQIPIALAGLLGGRRMLLATTSYGILYMLLIGFLQSQNPPLAGFFSAAAISAVAGTPVAAPDIGQPLVFFVAVTLLNAFLLDRFGGAFRSALHRAQGREAELETIRGSLESTVTERTAALEQALHEQRLQTAEQAALLAENTQQRTLMREMSVPILPVSQQTLIMPLVGALDGDRLVQIQEQALSRLEATHARQLLMDITGVPVVDTQVAQGLMRVVGAARLLGAEIILIGIRPEVAQSIVGLGIDLSGIRTHSDLQSALAKPEQRRQ